MIRLDQLTIPGAECKQVEGDNTTVMIHFPEGHIISVRYSQDIDTYNIDPANPMTEEEYFPAAELIKQSLREEIAKSPVGDMEQILERLDIATSDESRYLYKEYLDKTVDILLYGILALFGLMMIISLN